MRTVVMSLLLSRTNKSPRAFKIQSRSSERQAKCWWELDCGARACKLASGGAYAPR